MKKEYLKPEIIEFQIIKKAYPICSSANGDLSELHEKGDLDGFEWVYN